MTTQTTPPIYFLLVDDLEENLISLEALLRRDGLILLKAKSGPEALELLLQYEVALALLDEQMPGMDGFQLAELVRGTERTRNVPIIFVTAGSSDYQRRFRGYEAGAVDFLQKPIEPDILRSKTNIFFELYQQRQRLEKKKDLLRERADALREADRHKDAFLATLAHELRNPLAPIRSGLTILRTSPDNKNTTEIKDMMDRQLTHLVRLIDDLMDMSRVSQGKIDLRHEKITLQDALQSAIEASRPAIDASHHRLTINITDETLWLTADIIRISQIVSNLLNNAAKYTPPGGIIQLSAKRDNDEAVITVQDNGRGIRPDMIHKVFDLFMQIDRTVEKAQGGIGIGLALAKRLVEMHGGTIAVESAGMGKGSSFTVRLPLTSPGAKETSQAEVIDALQQPLKVLIVDDNIPSAQTIGWMLELIGHEPHLAYSGQDALNAAKTIKPNAILLDIGLPGMNGYEVCRILRQDSEFKDTLIIAQTGWSQKRDRDEAIQAGFNHHLVKPVDMDELAALLNTA